LDFFEEVTDYSEVCFLVLNNHSKRIAAGDAHVSETHATVVYSHLAAEKAPEVIPYLICEPPPCACPEQPLHRVAWTSKARAPKQVAGLRPIPSSCSALGMNQLPISAWLSRPQVSGQRFPKGLFRRSDQG